MYAHWTGPWTIIQQDGTSVNIRMGTKEQVNRVCPLLQKDTSVSEGSGNWTPPLFQHVDSGNGQDDENPALLRTTHSGRIIRPPDRYGQE